MAKQKLVLVAIPHEAVRKGVCIAFAEEPDVMLYEALTEEVLQRAYSEGAGGLSLVMAGVALCRNRETAQPLSIDRQSSYLPYL